MRVFKPVLLLFGTLLIIGGYRLLAVPQQAGHDEILKRAKNGMLCVVCGGALVMAWLAKR